MSSVAQITANRQNAKLCTGPKTEAGKQASKSNAWRHGLCSTQIVLPHEDRAAFEDLKAGFIADHQPVGHIEQIFVAQLAETWWRYLRARRVETEYLGKLVAANPEKGDAAIADAVTAEKDNAFAKLQRYVNAADRAFKKVLAQLREIQVLRLRGEHQQRVDEFLLARAAGRIGFVSQQSGQPEKTAPPITATTPAATPKTVSNSKIRPSTARRRS